MSSRLAKAVERLVEEKAAKEVAEKQTKGAGKEQAVSAASLPPTSSSRPYSSEDSRLSQKRPLPLKEGGSQKKSRKEASASGSQGDKRRKESQPEKLALPRGQDKIAVAKE